MESANGTTHRTKTIEDDLDLNNSVAGVVIPVCDRLGLRHYLKGQHLHSVMLDLVSLRANGANESELLAYGLALTDLARTLCSAVPSDEKIAARMKLDADVAEDHLRGVLAIDGEAPSTLEAHASLLEQEAKTAYALARVQRKKARQIRSARTQARQRFNLEPRAS